MPPAERQRHSDHACDDTAAATMEAAVSFSRRPGVMRCQPALRSPPIAAPLSRARAIAATVRAWIAGKAAGQVDDGDRLARWPGTRQLIAESFRPRPPRQRFESSLTSAQQQTPGPAFPPSFRAGSRPGGGRRGKGGSSPCSPCSAALRAFRVAARGSGPAAAGRSPRLGCTGAGSAPRLSHRPPDTRPQ